MTGPAPWLSIAGVGELCADVARSSHELFVLAGRCVTESEGAQQRWFAAACDRHAWHAELAVARSPRIPLVVPIERESDNGLATTEPTSPAAPVWLEGAVALRDRLLAAYGRLHPQFDPATARLIQLVVSDLDELVQQLFDPAVEAGETTVRSG